MSDETPLEEGSIPRGGEVRGRSAKPPTPKTIAAQSQARNSAAKIYILGGALFILLILTGIALFVRPEAMRDLLWASVSLIAYLAGSGEFSRKEEK